LKAAPDYVGTGNRENTMIAVFPEQPQIGILIRVFYA
jgi:hypothetical protein